MCLWERSRAAFSVFTAEVRQVQQGLRLSWRGVPLESLLFPRAQPWVTVTRYHSGINDACSSDFSRKARNLNFHVKLLSFKFLHHTLKVVPTRGIKYLKIII